MTNPPSPLAVPLPWNLVASAYAAEVTPMFESFAREAIALAGATPESRVLDVACGPGTVSLLAARAGLVVDALDFSPAMIKELEARLAAHAITTVTPRLGDGQALPFTDGSFAAAFSMFGLMFFPDRARGFAELRRVLHKGAKAVVSSWTPMEQVPVMGAMFSALREGMGKALAPGATAPGPQEMPLSSEAACVAEMSTSFRDVKVYRAIHTERFASADALWESFTRTLAPVVLMKQSLGAERWAPLDAAARAAIRGVIGEGPGDMTLTALLSVGVAA